ncbi:hypothetical protein NDU88_005102 [Pleurodeles waltl]|uniref:Uncharacterized protein n=1 Tax=Pleurodeles waltl TaxID=8319 RepID=A0AAV7W9H3_PLEWA|nr:hypothetical protein NDU88_005102 [Pleurodeles waltl]
MCSRLYRTPKNAIRECDSDACVPWRPLSLAEGSGPRAGTCSDRRCGPRRDAARAAERWQPCRDQGSIAVQTAKQSGAATGPTKVAGGARTDPGGVRGERAPTVKTFMAKRRRAPALCTRVKYQTALCIVWTGVLCELGRWSRTIAEERGQVLMAWRPLRSSGPSQSTCNMDNQEQVRSPG